MPDRRTLILRWLALYGGMLGGLAGCGGSSTSSGSGIVATGKGLINGNVVSTDQPGGVDGITVGAGGQTTRTDGSGRFSLANVPAGNQTVGFLSGGTTASLSVTVPDSQTVELRNIRISGSTATADSVSVNRGTSGSSGSSGSSGPGGGGGSSGAGSSGSSGGNGSSGSSGSSGSG